MDKVIVSWQSLNCGYSAMKRWVGVLLALFAVYSICYMSSCPAYAEEYDVVILDSGAGGGFQI